MKKNLIFIVLIILIFLITDKIIEYVMTPYFLNSGQIPLNCYEILRRDHPEKEWQKVFFGSSVTISGFREEESTSGYINAGLNCGLITDLWGMIEANKINIGKELVIGFNSSLSLYDDFMRDYTNPWYRKWYEPYCYFYRDRLKTLISNAVLTYLFKQNKLNASYKEQNKRRELYFGAMSEQALQEKLTSERAKFLYEIKFENLRNNIIALEKVRQYCNKNGIRLRFVWIPCNPTIEMLSSSKEAYEFLKDYAIKNNIDFMDLTGRFDKECYYDQGHFNYEYGAHIFTEVVDPWLKN